VGFPVDNSFKGGGSRHEGCYNEGLR